MSSIEAPHITINTPFTIDESVLTGFDYTITNIEYIRNAVGARITNDMPPMPKRFHAYNHDLATVSSDMSIKLISINEISITDDINTLLMDLMKVITFAKSQRTLTIDSSLDQYLN